MRSTDYLRPDIDALKPISAASTSTLPPAALSTEEEDGNNLLARCSMQVRNNDTMLNSPTLVDSSLDPNKGSSIECSKVRYITNSTPSYLFGVVLMCMETKVHHGQNMFERPLIQSPVLLEPLLATAVGRGPWPPPKQHCNTLLSQAIHVCFSLWSPFSRDWIAVQQRIPWPPSIQQGMQTAGVQFRPTPWPSFCCHTVVVHQATVYWQTSLSMLMADSVNKCLVGFFSCESSDAIGVRIVAPVLQWSNSAYERRNTFVTDVQLRPIPWPPFCCYTVGKQWEVLWTRVFCCSDCDWTTRPLRYKFNSDCWKHCLASVLQSHWVKLVTLPSRV